MEVKILNGEFLSLRVDRDARAFIHLGEEELSAIARAVCDEMANRTSEKLLEKIKRLGERLS